MVHERVAMLLADHRNKTLLQGAQILALSVSRDSAYQDKAS